MNLKIYVKKPLICEGPIKAYVDVVVGDLVCISGFEILEESKNGEIAVLWPSTKVNGVIRDSVYALNVRGSELINEAILKAYQDSI